MTKTKLLVTASALTAIIAVVSFSVPGVDAQTPAGFEPIGKQVVFHQTNWNGVEDANRLAIDLTAATATPPNNWRTFWQDNVHSEVVFPGATGLRLVRSSSYRLRQNVQVKAGVVEGRRNGVIATDFYISDGLTASTGDTVLWQAISFAYRAPNRDALTLSYRVADTLTIDPAAADWQTVTLRFVDRNQTAKIKINPSIGRGKFLQFKTNISKQNNFLNTATVVGQPLRSLATGTPTPTVDPTDGNGNGGTPTPTLTPTPIPTTTTITDHFKAVQQAWVPLAPVALTPKIMNQQTEIMNDRYCSLADAPGTRSYQWSKSLRSVGVVSTGRGGGDIIGAVGVNGRALRNAYVISNPLTFDSEGTISWERLDIEFDKNVPGTTEVYYRLFDDPAQAINKPVDPTWIKLADPATVSPTACESSFLASYQLHRSAKYIQYKFHVVSKTVAGRVKKQVVRRINLSADTVRTVVVSPTPTAAPTPTPTPTDVNATPTPTPTGSGTASGTGRMTILTKVLKVPSPTPTPDESGPDLPPSATPSASATPSTPPALSSLCFNQYETETAPNVDLRVKAHADAESFDAEDQTTDDEGVWRGLDGERDEFPVGRYDVTFGEFEPDELTLVAFCVEPNDDRFYVQTAMNLKTKLAAINVLPGAETRLIALYAPKNQPFVKIEKYALVGSIDKTGAIVKEAVRKKLRTVNPGQTFLYRIAYENTANSAVTEADAKDVLIQDVIPEGLQLPEIVVENPELYDIEIRYNTAKNQVIIARTIDRLKAGESGYIDIQVTVNASLFPVK